LGGAGMAFTLGCQNSSKKAVNQQAATSAPSFAAASATASAAAARSATVAAAAATAAPKRGGRITMGGVAPLHFNPNTSAGGNDWPILYNVYDTLLAADLKGNILPRLAVSWESADNAIVLTLRPNVLFHDGTSFDAAALKANAERTLSLKDTSRVFSQWSVVDKVEAIDPLHAKLSFSSPQFGPFLGNLTANAGLMPSPTAVQKLGQDFELHPVGTGPFVLSKAVSDSSFTLDRFDKYWGSGLPYVDGIDYKVVSDIGALVSAAMAGEIDVLEGTPTAQQIDQLATAGLNVLNGPLHSYAEFRLNVGVAPFNNPNLLKAVCSAIDRDVLLKGIFKGNGEAAVAQLNEQTWAFNPAFKQYSLDLSKARQYLQQGGAPQGFSFTDKVIALSPIQEPIALAVKDQLAQVGITMNIENQPTPSTDFLYKGDYQASNVYTPYYTPDPDSIFRPSDYSTGQFNYHNFKHPEVDRLIDQAAAEPDQAKRIPMYWQLQQMIFDLGVPRIPVVFFPTQTAIAKRVRGIELDWQGQANAMRPAWLAS